MPVFSLSVLKWFAFVAFAGISSGAAAAQLVCCDSFEEYPAGNQIEDGATNSNGNGENGGAGWGGAYNVANNIKQLVKIEDRTGSPTTYSNGEISILGGGRALRFYDNANGNYAVRRPLGTTFQAAAGESLWFGFLFRTNNASPLSNQDFFQLGFDKNANASSGIPRVSIGANTTADNFPAPFRFFARSTTAIAASAFCNTVDIQAASTYFLVGSIQPNGQGKYDTVSLFVNPTSLADPGPPSATITLDSDLASLSYVFIRTAGLDGGDAYVIDEMRIARDYPSVVQSLQGSLKIIPPNQPGDAPDLRWPASLTGAVLENSATLASGSWTAVPGPFLLDGAEYRFPIPLDPQIRCAFFRLHQRPENFFEKLSSHSAANRACPSDPSE